MPQAAGGRIPFDFFSAKYFFIARRFSFLLRLCRFFLASCFMLILLVRRHKPAGCFADRGSPQLRVSHPRASLSHAWPVRKFSHEALIKERTGTGKL